MRLDYLDNNLCKDLPNTWLLVLVDITIPLLISSTLKFTTSPYTRKGKLAMTCTTITKITNLFMAS